MTIRDFCKTGSQPITAGREYAEIGGSAIDTPRLGSVEGHTLDMDYDHDPIHSAAPAHLRPLHWCIPERHITRKNQHHTVSTLEGDSTKQATTYDWSYAYDAQGSANAAGG
uniref:hypothetical protein n=1 Tax=Thiohalomonas denitrificans TaxID=415747 RepID=UPI0026ED7C05